MIGSKNTHWYTDWKCWLSAFLLITILPYLTLIFSSFPLPGDDFNFSLKAKQAWEATGRVMPTIQAAWQHTLRIYEHWQGSLSGVFIMSISPVIISITAYRIALFFFNILFIFGVFFSSNYFIRKYTAIPKNYTFLIGSAIVFTCYHFMPSLFEFLYWYNGSSYYLLPLTIALFSSVLLHKTIHAEKTTIFPWILLSIISVFFGLNNLPMLMTMLTVLFFVTVFLFFKKSKKKYAMLIIYALFIAASIVNISAPGNFNRMTKEKIVNISLVKTMLISSYLPIKAFLSQFGKLSLIPLFLVLMTPSLNKHIDSNQAKFMNPLVLLIISYLIIVSQFTVTVYTSGNMNNYGRVSDYRYILYQILIVINYINLLVYLKLSGIKLRKKTDASVPKLISQRIAQLATFAFIVYAILATALSFRFFLVYPSNPVDLYKQITANQLQTYRNEQAERFEIAEKSSGQDIVYKKLTYTTSLIGLETIKLDPDHNVNKKFAEFYHLNSVVVEE